MSPNAKARCNVFSLAAISLLSALIWRAEVEWHGWGGLTWIGYFHWAIPVGFALFLIWLAVFCGARSMARRAGFVLCVAVVGVSLYPLLDQALRHHYVTGPAAMMLHLNSTPLEYLLRWAVPYAFLLGSPIALWSIARLFSLQSDRYRLLLSLVIMTTAIPMAMLGLTLIAPSHEVNEIHTIKSGLIIIPVIFGLGCQFAPPLKAVLSDAAA